MIANLIGSIFVCLSFGISWLGSIPGGRFLSMFFIAFVEMLRGDYKRVTCSTNGSAFFCWVFSE